MQRPTPMPRKHFRKFLPSHDSVKKNRYIAPFGSALQHHNLWHLNRWSVAGGVAVGLFCGLVPGPLQMLSAALCAILLRFNLPVALVTTLYSNPFTILPLYLLAYKLGSWLTGQTIPGPTVGQLELSWSNFAQWIPLLIDWVAAMGKPLLIGLPLLASILAATGYLVVLGGWRLYVATAWRRRRHARAARAHAPPPIR